MITNKIISSLKKMRNYSRIPGEKLSSSGYRFERFSKYEYKKASLTTKIFCNKCSQNMMVNTSLYPVIYPIHRDTDLLLCSNVGKEVPIIQCFCGYHYYNRKFVPPHMRCSMVGMLSSLI